MGKSFLSLLTFPLLFTGSLSSAFAQFSTNQNFETTGSTLDYTQTVVGNPGIPGTLATGTAVTIAGSNTFPKSGSGPSATYPNNFTSTSTGFVLYNPNGVGIANPISQLDFSPVFFRSSLGSTISFRLAVYGDGNGTGIVDGGDPTVRGRVVLSLATNLNNNTFTDYITITGPNPTSRNAASYWDFGATGIAATTYPTPITARPTVGNVATSTYGGNGTGFGRVTLTLPAGITLATLRITLEANLKSALLIDDVVITSASPLPVTLTSFAATRQLQDVYVKWATAMEKNNAYFEVQRSADSKTFTAIGQVSGNGTTAIGASYSFLDRTPLAGLSYYRLRQVDTDGTEAFSSVVVVTGIDKLEAVFYPNPSNSSITLPATGALVKYRIYSTTGQTVATGEAEGGADVDVQKVPAGLYFLELTSAGKQNVQRFVRQ